MDQTANAHALGYGNTAYGNVTNSHNNITIKETNYEGSQIKQWLSPLEPQYRHRSVQANRVDGVGSWLLEKNEVRGWSGSLEVPKQAVLFCYGDPGVGKTHISSLVIDSLCDRARDRDTVVAGLYCDYLAQEEQSAQNMLGAILNQLLVRDGIPEPVRQAFRKEKMGLGGQALQLLDLVKMLKTTIATLSEVFICIDGLDECLPRNRRELLESLEDIVRASPNTRVFLSGRPQVLDEVKRHFTEAIIISVIPTVEDIKRYLKMRLDRDATPSAMDENLRAEIVRVIPGKISQIFLLVSLTIDAVLEETTIHQRKKKLGEMIQGNELRDAYSSTLARIKAQEGSKSRLGMEALLWLSYSERPLNADELCHALGVEIGSTDLNSQKIPTIETLLECSLGLVTVEAPSYTVRFVHYTLKEYLSNNTDLFPNPHSMIARVCLTYLNFQCVRDLSPILCGPPPGTPFLEYASSYWGTHARRETTDDVNTLALRLLDEFDKHVSSGILLSRSHDNWDSGLHESNPMGFTGLHATAYLGIVETAVTLLKMREWDLNVTDVAGNTAISWAARKGYGAIVRMLLGRDGIAPDTADKGGRTPLSWAADFGNEDVVKMLLERGDVAPNIADKDGRTPLLWAARNGRGGVVKDLLARKDVTPDIADKGGQTPLSCAAGFGNEDIVGMLLERKDVTPDIADKDSQTPLSWAAGNGHGGVVKMLLESKDVTPDIADKDGRTPLSWAAGNGHGGVVKMLLESEDVTPDIADKDGRTPLSWAARNGCGGVMKELLESEDVTPDSPDNDGRTPLSWAANIGNEGIVRMLLEHRDVAPDSADKGGRTPLSWAANSGNEGVVRMLLEQKDVAPDSVDKGGRTPLLWAAGCGHGNTVRVLMGREDVTPNTADNDGRTPLFLAAGYGHGDVVKLLVGRDDVTPNTVDKGGRTPLLSAVRNGREEVVKTLLEREDVTLDIADKGGRTPLSWAADFGNEEIVRMLLEQEDVAPETLHKDGRTPLLSATKRGHTRVVGMLQGRCRHSQDTAMTDLTSQTPLAQASGKQYGGVLKRGLGNQDLAGHSSVNYFPADSPESFQYPSKMIRRS